MTKQDLNIGILTVRSVQFSYVLNHRGGRFRPFFLLNYLFGFTFYFTKKNNGGGQFRLFIRTQPQRQQIQTLHPYSTTEAANSDFSSVLNHRGSQFRLFIRTHSQRQQIQTFYLHSTTEAANY